MMVQWISQIPNKAENSSQQKKKHEHQKIAHN